MTDATECKDKASAFVTAKELIATAIEQDKERDVVRAVMLTRIKTSFSERARQVANANKSALRWDVSIEPEMEQLKGTELGLGPIFTLWLQECGFEVFEKFVVLRKDAVVAARLERFKVIR